MLKKFFALFTGSFTEQSSELAQLQKGAARGNREALSRLALAYECILQVKFP